MRNVLSKPNAEDCWDIEDLMRFVNELHLLGAKGIILPADLFEMRRFFERKNELVKEIYKGASYGKSP